jgi:hypothetical protein
MVRLLNPYWNNYKIKMILPKPQGEKSVEELMKEYVSLQQRIKFDTLELEDLKVKIDKMIPEDKFAIEGVAIFQRKAGSVRQLFDKTKAKDYLNDEQYNSCIKESKVKPLISIISWENNELRKQMMKGKE